MSIFYVNEHTSCLHYHDTDQLAFEVVRLEKGVELPVMNDGVSVVACVLEGRMLLHSFGEEERSVDAGMMVLLPKNRSFYGSVAEDSEILLCRIEGNVPFCQAYSLASLKREMCDVELSEAENGTNVMWIKPNLKSFVDFLKSCLEDGINCVHYHEMKLKEFFILLRSYYSKEELYLMFCPILSSDSVNFKDFVLENYEKVDAMNELAGKLNMTMVTFHRRFKEEFQITLHQWELERKAEKVFKSIRETNKSFEEIADEFRFSSVSYLSTFCKNRFNKSPSELRYGNRK